MAITILPKEEGWGETLGTSIGSGLRTLMQGKAEQLERRANAKRFQAMGLDENLAYVPEKFGLKALGETYTRQRQEAQSKQQEQNAVQLFSALATQGKQLGLSDAFLKTAISAGPEEGSKILSGMIRDLQKGDKKVGLLENLGVMAPSGRSPYKENKATTVRDELRQKYFGITPDAYAQEQVNKILNPSPEEKKRRNMEELNLKLQEEAQLNPPKNQLDIINNAAAQQLALDTMSRSSKQVAPEDDYNEDEALLNDPRISAEEKERLRREIAGEESANTGSYGLLETPMGFAGNFASGFTQGIGALAGLPRLLENVLSPVAQLITQPIVNAEIKEWTKKADEAVEGSPEQQVARRHVELLKNDQKNADLQRPSSIGFEDVKENVVLPIAKAFGAEKYITPRNAVEEVGDRVGKVAGGTLLSALARGSELGTELLKSMKLPLGAETVGVLTKKFTGSDTADGVMTFASYLLGAYSPDSWNKAISNGYNYFRNAITNVPKTRVPVANALEQIQPIVDRVQTLPNTQSNRFLKNQVGAIFSEVGNANNVQVMSPHKAFELDQLLGGDTYSQAEKIGKETAQAVDTMRSALRKIWEPYFMQNIPQATQGIIGAREAKAALNFTDKIQDRLQDLSTMKVPLFSVPGHIAKVAAKLAKPTRKFINQMVKSEVLRDATFEAIASAAKDDIVGMVGALNKVKGQRIN